MGFFFRWRIPSLNLQHRWVGFHKNIHHYEIVIVPIRDSTTLTNGEYNQDIWLSLATNRHQFGESVTVNVTLDQRIATNKLYKGDGILT